MSRQWGFHDGRLQDDNAGGELHESGVGLLLDPCRHVQNVYLATGQLKDQPFNISIIIVYAPTTDSTDEEIDDFYDKVYRGSQISMPGN